jgi:hypothetical protein
VTAYEVEPMAAEIDTIVISLALSLLSIFQVTTCSPFVQTVLPFTVVWWAEAGSASPMTTAATTPAISATRRRRRPTRNTFTVPPEDPDAAQWWLGADDICW